MKTICVFGIIILSYATAIAEPNDPNNEMTVLKAKIKTLQLQITYLETIIKSKNIELQELRAKIEPNREARTVPKIANTSSNNNGRWTSKSSPGDGSIFVFRDCKIGDPKSKKSKDFISKKDWETSLSNYKDERGLETCRDFSVQYTTNYYGGEKPYLEHTYFKIGDVEIESLDWFYYEDKLAGFRVIAKSELPAIAPSYGKLKSRLIAVYDEPSITKHGIVQNKLGAEFPQETLVWATPDGPMMLMNPSSQMDECELYMLSTDVAKKIEKKEKDIAEQNAHSTF